MKRSTSTKEVEQLPLLHGQETPAYQVLRANNLLDSRYLLQTCDEMDLMEANSSRVKNCMLNAFCCPFSCLFKTFETPRGHVTLVENGRGDYEFRGNGVHLICDPFYKVYSGSKPFDVGVIKHGDRTIVVVEQGKIGFAVDKGQPVLLPPGMHQWRSPTMHFEQQYDLNNNVIRMGPFTLVTVDEGYSAITEDNGKQVVLSGGDTYLLNHRNWKFQKYVSQKIQSSVLKRIEATSADNVLMAVDATVIWRIADVATAARNSAETISKDGKETDSHNLGDLHKLTNDVLKQSEASLAAFIGAVNYSDSFNLAAATNHSSAHDPKSSTMAVEQPDNTKSMASPLFDLGRLSTVVGHANTITSTYGVHIISINVVAAVPADKTLMSSLAQGAVAAAEAQKFETVARGRASAAKIEAEGEGQATLIRAKAAAEAEVLRADGAKTAADTIGGSDVAVQFALVDKTGEAIKDKATFFFGANSQDVGGLLVPPLVAAAKSTQKK